VGGLDANVRLIASDARIDNLDTIRDPLSLLNAVMNAPYELNNTATLGTSERPLRFATRFLIALTGDGTLTDIGFKCVEGTNLAHFRLFVRFQMTCRSTMSLISHLTCILQI
jgi:hypothetical protein